MATFVQDGKNIDHRPAAAVAAGDVVVQGELVGVARTAIAADALGSLAVTGVFDFPKAAGVGTAITAGAEVHWKAAAGQDPAVATAAANDGGEPLVAYPLIGKCVKAAVDADATVRVRLMQ